MSSRFAAVHLVLASALLALTPLAGPAHAGILGDLIMGVDDKPVVLLDNSNFHDALESAVNDGNRFNKVKLSDVPGNRLAISVFQVEYVNEQSAESAHKLFGDKDTTSVAMTYKLTGVPDETFQQLTEQLYTDFCELARARGYEVTPRDKLLANANFAKRVAGASSAGQKSAGWLRKDGALVTQARGTGDEGWMGSMKDDMNLASELGAIMVRVHLKLSIAQFKDTGGIFGGSGHTASLEASTKTAMTPGDNSLKLITAKGPEGLYELRRPVWLPSQLAEKVSKEGSSGGWNPFANLTSASYEITPVSNYADLAHHDLKLAMQMWSQALTQR